MKKIIYSILTLSLILTGSLSATSCSSDDGAPKENPGPGPGPGPEDDNPQTQTLVVIASASTAYLGETITLSATLDGAAVTSGVTYYVDDVAISGNTITSNAVADMLVSAKYENVTSEYISVAFAENPFLSVEGEGNFVYNGTTYQLDGAYLTLQGFYSDGNGGATAYWMQYGWSGNNPDTADNFVSIGFDTPATLVGNEVTDYILPNSNQNAIYIIGAIQANGQLIAQNEGVNQETGVVSVTGDIIYNSLNDQTNPATADFNITAISGVHNLAFTYSGDISPIASAKAMKAKQSNSGKHFVKPLSSKKIDKQALLNKILKK